MFFKYNDQDKIEHYIDGVLRATIDKTNFDEYKKYYPNCDFLA